MSLRLLALFSPVHVALYFLTFPLSHPHTHFTTSTSKTATYLTVLVMEALLTFQTGHLVRSFERQQTDKQVLSKEVLHEYDQKYVFPRLNSIKRDVATQTQDEHFRASVDVYTPMLDRRWEVHPNPKYTPFTVDPEQDEFDDVPVGRRGRNSRATTMGAAG